MIALLAIAAFGGSLKVQGGGDSAALTARVDALEAIGASAATLLWAGRISSGTPTVRDTMSDGATTGWSEWDQPTELTIAEVADGRGMTLTATAATGASGIYRAAPAGDFVATFHVGAEFIWDVDIDLDVFVADDISGSPGTARTYALRLDGPTAAVAMIDCTDFDTCGIADDTESDALAAPEGGGMVWMQLCVDDQVDLTGCVSLDGQAWACSAEIPWATAQIVGAADYYGVGPSGAGAGVVVVDYATQHSGLTQCGAAIGARDVAP